MRARTAGLLAAAALAAAAPSASAATTDAAAASRAAAWLAATPATGPGGQQADVIVALRAAGRPRAALGARLSALRRAAPSYAVTAGGAAKVVMAAVAAGADPSRLGGVDYVRRITGRYASGRYGATGWDQALSMLGLAAAGRPVPAAAIRATLAARGAGGWGLSASPSSGHDSVDATALTIEALVAAGLRRDDPGLRAGAAWMVAQRNRAGGYASAGGGDPTEANSTAGAIRALRALRRTPPASTRAALRALQQGDGGLRYTRAAAGSRLLATTDALVALAGRTLPVE